MTNDKTAALVEALRGIRDYQVGGHESYAEAYERLRNDARQALATLTTPSDAGEGWQDIATAPKDGTLIHVWATCYEWPETVRWENHDPTIAEEIGEQGYWRYADDLLTEATDSCCPEDWTHWRPLPAPPSDQPKQEGGE